MEQAEESTADELVRTKSEREIAAAQSGHCGMQNFRSQFFEKQCSVVLFWIFLAFSMSNLVSVGLLRNSASEWVAFLVTTSIFGQTAMLVTVAGLMGDNWLEGVFLAAGIAACLLLAIVVPLAGEGIGTENFVLLLPLIPLALLISASPLILMRGVWGWSLRTTRRTCESRERINIETMILLPASFVAIAVLANSTRQLSSEGLYVESQTVAFFSLQIGGVCLVVLVPMIGWAFRISNSSRRWVVCLGYSLGVALLIVLALVLVFRGFPGEAALWIFGCTFFSSVILTACFQILQSNGYHLSSFAADSKYSEEVGVPDGAGESQVTSPFDSELHFKTTLSTDSIAFLRSRRRHRVAVGMLVLLVGVVNSGAYAYKQVQYRQLFARIVAEGGAVEMVNGRATSLHFGPSTSDTWLVESPVVESVKSISLAGTHHKQLWGMSKFPALEVLDLRDCLIESASISRYIMSNGVQLKIWEGQFSSAEIERLVDAGYRVEQVAR